MIRVLIIDDSPCAAEFLAAIFASDQEFRVVGTAGSAAAGIRMVERLRPDIVSMDFTMPDMDGFEATRRIMSTHPTPIVIVSSLYDRHAVSLSFKSLEAGALAILSKPPSPASAEFPPQKQELLQTFRAMAGVRVIRRTAPRPATPLDPGPGVRQPLFTPSGRPEISLIAMGASTGGPQALHDILRLLSPRPRVPIVIVQHIIPGFTEGMAAWLEQASGLPVSVVVGSETFRGGHVYLAPQGVHLEVTPEGRGRLVDGAPEHGVRPSVSRLFRSVAACYGATALGVLLTGMGKDGAAELRLMRESGAMTIAQDRESSIVHGMPGEAIRLRGASLVLPPHAIAATINSLVCRED
jgi:two-component system chemotaxis response regulator CheB